MSTRCQIGVYRKDEKDLNKWEALIYRRSDGYPEGVLPDIIPFLKWFKTARGISDTEYVSARLLQWLTNEYDGVTAEIQKELKTTLPQHLSNDTTSGYTGTLGFGICKDFHGDIEYFYAVYPNGVRVYEVTYSEKKQDPSKWILLRDINLDNGETLEEILKAIEQTA